MSSSCCSGFPICIFYVGKSCFLSRVTEKRKRLTFEIAKALSGGIILFISLWLKKGRVWPSLFHNWRSGNSEKVSDLPIVTQQEPTTQVLPFESHPLLIRAMNDIIRWEITPGLVDISLSSLWELDFRPSKSLPMSPATIQLPSF